MPRTHSTRYFHDRGGLNREGAYLQLELEKLVLNRKDWACYRGGHVTEGGFYDMCTSIKKSN